MLAGTVLLAGCQQKVVSNEKPHSIEGVWIPESGEFDGDVIKHKDLLTSSKLTIDKNQYAFQEPTGEQQAGRIAINDKSDPKSFDLEFLEGPNKGKKSLGIFKIADNKLAMCFGDPGKERPSAFVTVKGSGQTVLNLVKKQ